MTDYINPDDWLGANPNERGLVELNNFYYHITEDSKKIPKISRISDFNGKILYRIEDNSIQFQDDISYVVELSSEQEGTSRVLFTGSDFANLIKFKSRLTTSSSQVFFGRANSLDLLVKHWLIEQPPKIRKLNCTGYDKQSKCFVFSSFMYCEEGERLEINDEGYFPDHGIIPYPSKNIENLDTVDPVQFLTDLFGAYGPVGFITLGFWISSIFSHTVYNRYKFFPFYSLSGDTHAGKSTLAVLLNRCFFMDWEGIPLTKSNTQKGELRAIAQKSSLVVPLLEATSENTKFDNDSLLPLYNRNPLQIRALKTNDNQNMEMEFNSTLAFIQNNEQFTRAAAKERVISSYLKIDNDQSDATFQHWERLQSYSVEQLAAFGDYIMRQRAYFEGSIIVEIDDITTRLKKMGVYIDRIAKNHAILIAGFMCLLHVIKGECPDKNMWITALRDYSVELAQKKMRSAKTEHQLADHFFETLFQVAEPDTGMMHADSKPNFYFEKLGYKIDENLLYLNLPQAQKALKKDDVNAFQHKDLVKALREHDDFVENNKTKSVGGAKYKCWVFNWRDD